MYGNKKKGKQFLFPVIGPFKMVHPFLFFLDNFKHRFRIDLCKLLIKLQQVSFFTVEVTSQVSFDLFLCIF